MDVSPGSALVPAALVGILVIVDALCLNPPVDHHSVRGSVAYRSRNEQSEPR